MLPAFFKGWWHQMAYILHITLYSLINLIDYNLLEKLIYGPKIITPLIKIPPKSLSPSVLNDNDNDEMCH